MDSLFWSLWHRPYVTGFMLGFFLLSVREQGWPRTLIWVASSYLIALTAEWGSIRHGIPFGYYLYHYEALEQDLIVFGVPFFDTISFSFLSYVSYSFAIYFVSPLARTSNGPYRFDTARTRCGWPALLVGSWLMVVIDLIVDPVANLGEHWFLGKIYDYPEPGIHFGVTFANYCGWFVVALLTLRINQGLDQFLQSRGYPHPSSRKRGTNAIFAPLFWAAIVGFQLGMTWLIALNPPTGTDPKILLLQAVTGSYILAPILILAVVQPFKARD